MAELAREGGVIGCPTEISECFCNLEEKKSVSGKASGSTGRRKLRGSSGSMLLHLTPKQLLVARKPTLMDDLITRNKAALLRNKMERNRGTKNKRSDVDSESDVPLAIKRLRSTSPLKVGKKLESQNSRNKARKRDSEDKKLRTTTRCFTSSSLRSGKKRTHMKDSLLLVEKRKSLKSSGSRSNDSETDVPSPHSSLKPNGHTLAPVDKDKKVEDKKPKKCVPLLSKNKLPGADIKPSVTSIGTNEPPIKKIKKKKRKFDSMIWLKRPKPKAHSDSKSFSEVVIKSEPLSQSEPEDSGLGPEVRLELGKAEDQVGIDSRSSDDIKASDELKSIIDSDAGVSSTSGVGKPVWNIEPFTVTPIKEYSVGGIGDCCGERSSSIEESAISELIESVLIPELDEECLPSPVPNISSVPEEDNEQSVPLYVESDKEETGQSTNVPRSLDETDSQIDYPSSPPTVDISDKPENISLESSISSELVKSENVSGAKSVVTTVAEESNSSDTKENSPSKDCLSEVDEIVNTVNESSDQMDIAPIATSSICEDHRETDVCDSLIEEGDVTDITLDDSSKDNQIDDSFELKLSSDTEEIESGQCDFSDKVQDSNLSTVAISEQIVLKETCSVVSMNICEKVVFGDPADSQDQEPEDTVDIKLENKGQDQLDRAVDEGQPSIIDDLRKVSVSETISSNGDIKLDNGDSEDINGCAESNMVEVKELKAEEGVERQALKVDLLKALGLQSLRPMSSLPLAQAKDVKEEKPANKVTEPGYTGTLKAVIKLNKGAPRSIVFKNNEETKPEYQISAEAAESGVPITHLADVSSVKKPKDIATDYDTVSNSSYVSTAPAQSDSGSEEEKPHGKESNLVIPEKSSSFSIHPGRLCCDVCCYCFGKFGSLDTPCHIAQLKGEERQQKILQNEPYLTLDSCLCDACYRYVDRKANCPSSAAAKTGKRARPPAATLCCVTDCTLLATHSVKRKWLLKIKRSLANKFEIDTEKHTSVFNPLCSNHHYWVDYYMVCGICRKRLNRNHLYTLGPEADRLNLVLAEDGIPARLSDKLFLCKLCRYYASMRLKYSDPTTIPPSSQPFYVNYRKKILASLDVPVSDSDEDKPKPKEGKDDDVMSLSGLATLLSDQPDPSQPRIQVKFGNVNIGTLSNLNIGQGRQEERSSYDRNEQPTLPLNAAFDFQGPSTSDGSWEKVTSTLQFDKKTKHLWQELQRPYGNQSSFLRHLVMLEKYWRSGYLVLSESADARTAKYINSVQTRNKSFEGKSELQQIKVETPPPPASEPTPPPQEPILKVPDPSKRFLDEPQKSAEQPKPSSPQTFCPIIPTGEVEVLPVNPNKIPPKEKQISKGTLIIQRPVSSQSQPPPSKSPCKIMITSVQSLAKPKVDPVLLNRAKSLVRMVSPAVMRHRPPLPVPIQRVPRPPRPRTMQYLQQPYQTLQAQLQAPSSNPLQSLQQVVHNRYPPPPLVKINPNVSGPQRSLTPRPLPPHVIQQQHSSSGMMHQQPAVTLLQQLQQPALSILHQQQSQHHSTSMLQQQPSVSLIQQQPSISIIQHQQQSQPSVSILHHPQLQSNANNVMQQQSHQGNQQMISLLQQPSISMQMQQSSPNLMQNQIGSHSSSVKNGPPPPYPVRSLLPKLPPSLSISTMPQTSVASLTPSVSLLPPSSPNGIVSSSAGPTSTLPLPPVSTLTSNSHFTPPPPYSLSLTPPSSITTPSIPPSVSVIPTSALGPSVTVIPSSLPSSITLPSSGITIEKQPHNFHTPPILPPEKPIISVFREPLPTDT